MRRIRSAAVAAVILSTLVAFPASTTAAGGSVTLEGPNAGDKIRVTVVSVRDPAPPGDDRPRPRNRYVAVKLRIANLGRTTYKDSSMLATGLLDTESQQWDPSRVGEVEPHLGRIVIPRAQQRVGWVTFEVPRDARFRWLIYESYLGAGEVGQIRLR